MAQLAAGTIFLSSFTNDETAKRVCATAYYSICVVAIGIITNVLYVHVGSVCDAIEMVLNTQVAKSKGSITPSANAQAKLKETARMLLGLKFLRQQIGSQAAQNTAISLIFAAWPWLQLKGKCVASARRPLATESAAAIGICAYPPAGSLNRQPSPRTSPPANYLRATADQPLLPPPASSFLHSRVQSGHRLRHVLLQTSCCSPRV